MVCLGCVRGNVFFAIAGDGAVFRDIILSAGVLDPLLYILSNYEMYDYMAVRITVWATANMCRGCRCSDPSWSLVNFC